MIDHQYPHALDRSKMNHFDFFGNAFFELHHVPSSDESKPISAGLSKLSRRKPVNLFNYNVITLRRPKCSRIDVFRFHESYPDTSLLVNLMTTGL